MLVFGFLFCVPIYLPHTLFYYYYFHIGQNGTWVFVISLNENNHYWNVRINIRQNAYRNYLKDKNKPGLGPSYFLLLV